MRTSQQLSCGDVVDQDLALAVRPILFETDLEDFRYATHGGTLFLICFNGAIYGVTCAHVFKDFLLDELVIFGSNAPKAGDRPAAIEWMCRSKSRFGGREEIDDISLIKFQKSADQAFFAGSPYVIDTATVGTSRRGHTLVVDGILKEKTFIDPPTIKIGKCDLLLVDVGLYRPEPFLRRARAWLGNAPISEVAGLSGAPVFDRTANVLCGMVTRGGLRDGHCLLYFLDVSDIVELLKAADAGAASKSYTRYFHSS